MKKLISALLCALLGTLTVVPAWGFSSALTGDTSNMGLWIAMVVVAVIAVVVLLIVGAKKKKK